MNCKILEIVYEFHNKDTETTNGLYHVEFSSGAKYYLLRNNDSVGAIQHYLDRQASECISIIRSDRKADFFSVLEEGGK